MKKAIKAIVAVAAFVFAALTAQAEYIRPGITINGTTPTKDGTYSGYTIVAAGALPIVVASDGLEPPLAESGSAVLTITPWSNSAETKGFEPLRCCRLPVFRTGAINQLCQISSW